MKTVGITLGDPAGIGPEVIKKGLAAVIADGRVERTTFRLFGPDSVIQDISARTNEASATRSLTIETFPTSGETTDIASGRYSTASGRHSLAALDKAVDQLAAGRISSLVTGPISKQAFVEAGLSYPGQSEFVADRLGCTEWAMMLGGPNLKVALVTTHLALRNVADAVTSESILGSLRVCDRFIRDSLNVRNPRIAVCGLNPHCGDNGRFGDEEIRVIGPAIEAARAAGIDASGPLPADTAFFHASTGQFDMVLAMYHDQGLGPLKLIHFHDAINVTMGLPAIRCSCDHGPAYDLAGKDVADSRSMAAAIMFASGFGFSQPTR